MSSLRNAVQRRNHKERAQPVERSKWGLLEKHKDYSQRARNFGEKKKKLRALRAKAADRNPDEFSFGMLSSRSEHGRKVTARNDSSAKPLSVDVVMLLKTQDASYIRTVLQQVRGERRRLEEGIVISKQGDVHLSGDMQENRTKGKHVMYLETLNGSGQPMAMRMEEGPGIGRISSNIEEAQGYPISNAAKEFKKGWKKAADEKERAMAEEAMFRQKKQRWDQGRAKRIELLKHQERELTIAERELEEQRARMHGNIGGVNKNGIKFKVRRKR